jgi:N-acetylornithine carbamoyltransferase
MKHFISGLELNPTEIKNIIQTAISWKKNSASIPDLQNKIMTACFTNPSLRTRLSFESGLKKLGGHANIMNLKTGYELEYEFGKIMNGNTAEHVKEAAQVISRYSDIIGLRNSSLITRGAQTADIKSSYAEYKQDQAINEFAKYATKPVINMESNMHHPCQGLADSMTITEISEAKKKSAAVTEATRSDRDTMTDVSNLNYVLTWVPHPKALPVATPHSQLLFPAMIGANVTLACPPEFVLDQDIITAAEKISGNKITISHNQDQALKNADVVMAKSWVSIPHFGDWETEKKIRSQYNDWTLTAEKMAQTNNGNFMHCLPMRRNIIATDTVIDAPTSKIIDQAENRMWAQMALVEYLLKN